MQPALNTTARVGPIAARRARVGRHLRKNAIAYWLILPSLVFLAAVEFYPLTVGLLESLKYHNRVQPLLTRYIGLDNFKDAIRDHDVLLSLRTSFVLVGSIVVASYLLGMVAGLLLHQRIRIRGIYRTLIMVPWVVPPVVAFISWQWLLTDQNGLINRLLQSLHLIDEPVLWLADSRWAVVSVIVVGTWARMGFMMITFLAALAAVPDDLTEAAQIDGASRWQVFRYVTFPLILPVTAVAAILQSIWTFNDFALPFVLTGGGPANATTTTVLLAYKEGFQRFNIGYGTSVAVLSMVLMLLLGTLYLRMQARAAAYERGGA